MDENREYTVPELMQLTGLTKNIVSYRIRTFVPEDMKRFEGNAWRVKAAALPYIDKNDNETINQSVETSSNDCKTMKKSANDGVSIAIDALTKQLEAKDLQIAEKDKQIADLSRKLDARDAENSRLLELLGTEQQINAGHVSMQIESQKTPSQAENDTIDVEFTPDDNDLPIDEEQSINQSINQQESIEQSADDVEEKPETGERINDTDINAMRNSWTFWQKLKFAFGGELPKS